MIKEFELYHGAVFAKLLHTGTENFSIKPYPTSSNASYIINDRVGIYIKHSTKRLTPWGFSFAKKHQDEILEMRQNLDNVFLLLVCGKDGIVTLSFDELKLILDEVHQETEWISAARNPRQEYKVKGSDGALGYKVGKNDFPTKLVKFLNSI